MQIDASPTVTGLILAGGRGRRVAGEDKGLMDFQNQPLIAHVIQRLYPQVEQLCISANRNIERYRQFGYSVIPDELKNYPGPLAGIAAGLNAATTDYVLTVPCDAPLLHPQLRQRLVETLLRSGKTLAMAFADNRLQPVCSLLPVNLASDIKTLLEQGERKVDQLAARFPTAMVDFRDAPECFLNLNRPEDWRSPPLICPKPLLGIAAFSGTGKTTLLCRLLPILRQRGIRVAVIKHAHHQFDIDKPGKDSYEIRQAGAHQVIVASSQLFALMQKSDGNHAEVWLSSCLARLDYTPIDLVLVEGFKQSAIPKLELHRPSLGHPLMALEDPNIVALATDVEIPPPASVKMLNLNDVGNIADYVQQFIQHPISFHE
ncbi:Molybdopterin-guanine dinucleotide biosynthesis protein MobA [Methylophaga frappieri]|uniref:Molybdenum cofactor guanylyltransferase n=1 Tax=Methylophaga frappieri (strain ATCC BAA-2434 / DSM 25690 / JAM7) TaxID=754477 RepID=I1YG10_METFJ|nr:molybdenum cofactor guanylyltransferase MobA [Methylophaga frappieri]AFJ01853.1 Molybdopterin-guanine dinucleotide biosynthesis protein MobA [Methylophaga frappieri]